MGELSLTSTSFIVMYASLLRCSGVFVSLAMICDNKEELRKERKDKRTGQRTKDKGLEDSRKEHADYIPDA